MAYEELGGFTAGMASSMKQLPTLLMQSQYLQEARKENQRRLMVEQMNAIRENLKVDAETMAPLSGDARKDFYMKKILPQVESLAKAQHELSQFNLPDEQKKNYDNSYLTGVKDDVEKNWMKYEGVSKQLDKIFQSDPKKTSIAQMLEQADYIVRNPGLNKTEAESVKARQQAEATNMLQRGTRQWKAPGLDYDNMVSSELAAMNPNIGRTALVLPEGTPENVDALAPIAGEARVPTETSMEAALSPGEKTSLLLSLGKENVPYVRPTYQVSAGTMFGETGPYAQPSVIAGIKTERYVTPQGDIIPLDTNNPDDQDLIKKFNLKTVAEHLAEGRLKVAEKNANKPKAPKDVNMVNPENPKQIETVTMYSPRHAELKKSGWVESGKYVPKKDFRMNRPGQGGAGGGTVIKYDKNGNRI